MIDFSILKNNENLLFIFIYFLVIAVAVAILIFTIALIIKLIKVIFKKIFQKNEDLKYSQDLEPVVPELEESKQERFARSTHGPKMQYYANSEKNEREKPDKCPEGHFNGPATIPAKRDLGGGEKDIEEGLSALKKIKKDDEARENDSIFQKIKIPQSKKVMPARQSFGGGGGGGGGGDISGGVKFGAGEQKLSDYQPVSNGKTSVIQNNRLEMLKGAEIKIPQPAPEERFSGNKEPILSDNNFSSDFHKDELHNKIKKADSKIPNDDSIFAGKEEISRIKLRYKLRYDPKIWKAQKDLRMNLSPTERVKLEKETFAPVYGRNISKKDLNVNIRRLGREWVSATNMKRKEVLRKQIKFFKKIGGVK